MQFNRTQKIIIVTVIIIVLVGLGFVLFGKKTEAPTVSSTATSTDTTASTTTIMVGGVPVQVNGGGSYTVTQVPVSGGAPQPIPNLDTQVTFTGVNWNTDQQAAITTQIKSLQATLKKDSRQFDAWINLGIQEKMTGNFSAALEAWTYAGKLAPKDFLSRGNIADLYGYYLHNNVLAEQYYAQAIKNGPTQEYLYVQFATFYRDVEKDNTKAKAIISEGLSKIPDGKALAEFQASL